MKLNDDILRIIFDYANIKCNFCKKIYDVNNNKQINICDQLYCNYNCYLLKHTEYMQYL